MKSKLIKASIAISVIAFITFLVFIQIRNTKHAENKVEFLEKNGEMAIGTITGKNYHSSQGVSQLKTIMYNYEVGNLTYKEKISSLIPKACSDEAWQIWATDNSNALEGDRFLVLYEVNDPSNSILRLDYPVKSEADIEKYDSIFGK